MELVGGHLVIQPQTVLLQVVQQQECILIQGRGWLLVLHTTIEVMPQTQLEPGILQVHHLQLQRVLLLILLQQDSLLHQDLVEVLPLLSRGMLYLVHLLTNYSEQE